MEYWKGTMSAPIDGDWKCQTCGRGFSPVFGGLTWGMVNGICRCDNCHTQYAMRYDGVYHTTPKCLLKEEYKNPAKLAFNKYDIPIDELTDEQWDEFITI